MPSSTQDLPKCNAAKSVSINRLMQVADLDIFFKNPYKWRQHNNTLQLLYNSNTNSLNTECIICINVLQHNPVNVVNVIPVME